MNELFGGDRNQKSFTLTQIKEMCFETWKSLDMEDHLDAEGEEFRELFENWWKVNYPKLLIKVCQENP